MNDLASISTLIVHHLSAVERATLLSGFCWGGLKVNNLLMQQSKTRIIPGPDAHFWKGNLPEVQKSGGFHNYLSILHKQYGSVVKFWLGPFDLIVSFSDPDHIAQISNLAYTPKLLQKPMEWMGDVFWINPSSNNIKKVKSSRAKLTPLLMADLLVYLCSNGQRYISRMLELWARKSSPFEIKEELSQVLFQVTGSSILGSEFDMIGADIKASLTYVLQGTQERLEEIFAPIYKPSYWMWKRQVSRLHGNIQLLISQAKRDPNIHLRKDFLSSLLRQKDEHGAPFFTESEVRGYLIDLLFDSGLQATPSALTWICYALAQHPDVQRKAQNEIDQVLNDQLPKHEDLQKLKYLTQVIKEGMRIYTPVSSTMRFVDRDLQIGNYFIHKGTSICIPVCVIHQDSKLWHNPYEFDPDRFNDETTKEQHRYAYLPFGLGTRGCIGARYAIAEMQWLLSMILQRFTLSLPGGQKIVPEMRNLALQPKFGLKLLVKPRSKALNPRISDT